MVYAGSADQNVKFALLVRDLNLDGTLLTFEEEIHTGFADPKSLDRKLWKTFGQARLF